MRLVPLCVGVVLLAFVATAASAVKFTSCLDNADPTLSPLAARVKSTFTRFDDTVCVAFEGTPADIKMLRHLIVYSTADNQRVDSPINNAIKGRDICVLGQGGNATHGYRAYIKDFRREIVDCMILS